MNERGWFTLLVRGLGLLFSLTSLSGVAMLLSQAIVSWVNTPSGQQFAPLTTFGGAYSYILPQGIASMIVLGAGLYLLFRGGRLIDWLCKSVVGRCAACGYRLQADQNACPECGVLCSPRR